MRREHLGKRLAACVPARAELVLVAHGARGCARTEEAPAEASALLVGPVDQAHGDGWLPLLCDSSQDLCAGDDVERAVEPAAVGHGVDVAADEQSAFGAPADREPLIARLVSLLFGSQRFELGPQPFLRLDPLVRPGDALCALLVARQLSELAKLSNRAACVKRHGRRAYWSARWRCHARGARKRSQARTQEPAYRLRYVATEDTAW
jgi:hypothetical protein